MEKFAHGPVLSTPTPQRLFLPRAQAPTTLAEHMRYFELLRNRKVMRSFSLEKTPLFVGRGSDCDIEVESESVSRTHARIDCHLHGCTITDLESGFR